MPIRGNGNERWLAELIQQETQQSSGTAISTRYFELDVLTAPMRLQGVYPRIAIYEVVDTSGCVTKIKVIPHVRCVSCGRVWRVSGKKRAVVAIPSCGHAVCRVCIARPGYTPGICDACGELFCGRCLHLHDNKKFPELIDKYLCRSCSDRLAKKRWWR